VENISLWSPESKLGGIQAFGHTGLIPITKSLYMRRLIKVLISHRNLLPIKVLVIVETQGLGDRSRCFKLGDGTGILL
jgi:hypothetical protein